MATFIGFNTINQNKKFTLTDSELVKRDLLNSLNIQQGSLPGRPGFGTTIWSYLFENQTVDLVAAMTREMERLISYDPRVALQGLNVFPQDNGILLQVQVVIVPNVSVQTLNILFDQNSRQAVPA